jgi:6-pyruvoyltetrahydropterin/6-carboxytetrahydropterin synthase
MHHPPARANARNNHSMFEVSVEAMFSAAHALLIGGDREPVHGHNWHIVATVAGPALDPDGLLVDFHVLERALADITRRFHNFNLNAAPPFDKVNPSAERVAQYIAYTLEDRLAQMHSLAPTSPATAGCATSPQHPRVVSVRVTEAPGCSVTYRPSSSYPPSETDEMVRHAASLAPSVTPQPQPASAAGHRGGTPPSPAR